MPWCIKYFFVLVKYWNNIAPLTVSSKINNKIKITITPNICYFLLLSFICINRFYLNTKISFAI